MRNNSTNIGKNIRALRLSKGWTQKELSEKLGCTQKTITAYECNTRYPTAEKLPAIARVFGVSVNDLYGKEFKKNENKVKNPKLWKRFEKIETLSPSDKTTIFKMIDSLITHQKPQ